MYKTSFLSNFKKSSGIGNSILSKSTIILGLNFRTPSRLIKQNSHVLFLERLKTNLILDKHLLFETTHNIKFLKDNKTFRGIRHLSNLPSRGQRTHTNAKTKKKCKV